MLPAVRQVVRELEPGAPLSNVATIDELVAQSLEQPQSLSLLVAGFALIALALSVVRHLRRDGVLRPAASQGHQHSHRARREDAGVLRLVVGQGMKVVAAGIAVGLLGSLALTRLTASLLFG